MQVNELSDGHFEEKGTIMADEVDVCAAAKSMGQQWKRLNWKRHLSGNRTMG